MKKVFLVIAMIGIIFLVGCDKTKENTVNNDVNNEAEYEDLELSKHNIKIDDSKNWVYKADYENDVTKTSYKIADHTYKIEDIEVPFINIDSEDAKKANDEIKSTYDKAIEAFKEGLEDDTTYVDACEYRYYTHSNLLSVLTTLGIGATDVVYPEYKTYNFDIENGKLLTYEEICKIVNLNSANLEDKIQKAINNAMEVLINNTIYLDLDEISSYFQVDKTAYKDGMDLLCKLSFDNYTKSVENNELKYYVDSKGKLNIVVSLVIPAGRDYVDKIILVD